MRLRRDPRDHLVSIRRLGGEDWIRAVLEDAGIQGLETGETNISVWVQRPTGWQADDPRWGETAEALDKAGAVRKTGGVEVDGQLAVQWHVTHVVERGRR